MQCRSGQSTCRILQKSARSWRPPILSLPGGELEPGWNMDLEIVAFHPNSEAFTMSFPPGAQLRTGRGNPYGRVVSRERNPPGAPENGHCPGSRGMIDSPPTRCPVPATLTSPHADP